MLPAPPGFVTVEIGKGCVLLLTFREYRDGLRRGKFYRRRLALVRRLTTNGTSPLPGQGPGEIAGRET